MKPSGVIDFDITAMANGLNLTRDQVCPWFKDGRHSSKIIELNVARDQSLTMAQNGTSSYDLVDSIGGKWEVRSITAGGVSLAPSGMLGKGRKFDAAGMLAKIAECQGFIFADIESFPDVPYWVVPRVRVEFWIREKLSKAASAPRDKILGLLRDAFYIPPLIGHHVNPGLQSGRPLELGADESSPDECRSDTDGSDTAPQL